MLYNYLYDAVAIIKAKDEKAAKKTFLSYGDIISTETLNTVPREEALKLLE